MSEHAPSKDFLWMGFLIFSVLLFWLPVLNVQPELTPGDMGRDLYAFQETLRGHWPCRDYWWQYGPLMPLYYAFMFLMGGVNLLSVRIGLGLIYLSTSLLAYRALRCFTAPPVAYLSSFAFLNCDITWTFNHIGAFPFLTAAVLCLWRFFLTHKIRWSYGGTLALIGLALVKINMGVSFFGAYLASLFLDCWLCGEPRGRTISLLPLFLLFTFTVFSVYLILYRGLPFDWVDQCLTIRSVYRPPLSSPWVNFKYLVLNFLIWRPRLLVGAGIFLTLGIFAFLGIQKKKTWREARERSILYRVVGSLILFGLASTTDYFLMEGMIYRFEFWIFPVLVLAAGFLAQEASALFGITVKTSLFFIILIVLSWIPFQNVKNAFAWKIPERYLDLSRGKVYVGGPLPNVGVIREGTRFILGNTHANDPILAIPYEPLYCFLSGRRHAVRELIFMKHNQIQDKQEERIIRELTAQKVPLFLISNRYTSSERGVVGYFGKTHCRKLNHYLLEHYEEQQTFGIWQPSSGYHAIKFFRRKN